MAGLRDRALLSVMLYSFARVSAALGMRRQDYLGQGSRGWLRLHEKGGKRHDVPVTSGERGRDHHRAPLPGVVELAALGRLVVAVADGDGIVSPFRHGENQAGEARDVRFVRRSDAGADALVAAERARMRARTSTDRAASPSNHRSDDERAAPATPPPTAPPAGIPVEHPPRQQRLRGRVACHTCEYGDCWATTRTEVLAMLQAWAIDFA